MSTPEDLSQLTAKLKDSIKRESARALADIDTYTAMVTSHPRAAHDDIERGIEVSRKAQDSVSETKSAAMVATDNVTKEQQDPL